MSQYGDFAEIYDTLMDDVDYKKWIEYYLECFKKIGKNPGTIVDLACGTGNITIPIAKKGYKVTGIDISESMLRIAMEKSRKNGVMIPFIHQSICDFELHEKVDCILCCCDGINYITKIDDIVNCFTSVYNYLKCDGLFLFDISSKYKLKNIVGNNFFGEDRGNITYLWQNTYDYSRDMCTMDITFFTKETELYRKFREIHYQKAYDVQQLQQILEHTGFDIIGIYNDFTFNNWNAKSERINFICKK